MLKNRRTIRVEWGDCDGARIVFYPRYFQWFDACTTALLAAAGFPQPDLVSKYGIDIPMVDVRSRFLLPSQIGEELTVETMATRFGRSSFDVHHRMLKGNDLAVECWETRVWTRIGPPEHRDKLRSEPLPEDLVRALSRDLD